MEAEKQLRRLDRMSLVEIIVKQRKQIEDLQSQLATAEERLASRSVSIDLQNVESWEEAARFLVLACDSGRPGGQEMPEDPESGDLEIIIDPEDDRL